MELGYIHFAAGHRWEPCKDPVMACSECNRLPHSLGPIQLTVPSSEGMTDDRTTVGKENCSEAVKWTGNSLPARIPAADVESPSTIENCLDTKVCYEAR